MPTLSLDREDSNADFVFVEKGKSEFAKVTDATQLSEVLGSQSKDSRSLRLNPTQLNNLNLAYIEGPLAEKSKKNVIEEGIVRTAGNYSIDTAYKKIDCGNDHLPCVVFQVTRDSKKDDRSKNLAYINDVISNFLKKNPDENVKLLLPMSQCRPHLVGKKKKHYVLVEVTINGTHREIVIHNSQSKWSVYGYSNCLNNLKGVFECEFKKHHAYDQQKDNFSCGLFVYRYIQLILESGNAKKLQDIRVSLADPCLNLGALINHNLSQVISAPRKVVSSEDLPWKRKELEKFLKADFVENLDHDIDFPDDIGDQYDSHVLSMPQTANSAQRLSISLFFLQIFNKLFSPCIVTGQTMRND